MGPGVEIGASVAGVEGEIGMHADIIFFKWSKSDGLDLGQELSASAGTNAGPFSVGPSSYSWDSLLDNNGPTVTESLLEVDGDIAIFGVQLYALWGANVNVNLKWKDALKEIVDNL